MFKKIIFVIFTAFYFTVLHAGEIDVVTQVNNQNLSFTSEENIELTFQIFNNTNETINLKSIKHITDKNYFLSTSFAQTELTGNADVTFKIFLKVPQNIEFPYIAFVDADYLGNTLSIPLIADLEVHFRNTYYSGTYNLYGDELRSKLTQIISNAQEYTYKEARNHIWSFDVDENNVIECVYTGKTTTVTFPPDFAELDKNGFNTEHTWPRAEGADKEPELSDMFHIYATDKNANSKRGNYAFGNVTQNIFWEDGGSKLGLNDDNGERFEPRDVHKGNVARSMFYFAIRYYNKFNNFNFLAKQENDLREWMDVDPVDFRESRRNDSIYKYQQNRNPFIDYPQFLERIASISGTADLPEKKALDFANNNIEFSFNDINDDELTLPIYLANTGNTAIQITSANQLTKNSMPVTFEANYPFTIEPGKTVKINSTATKSFDNYAEYEFIDSENNKYPFSVRIDPVTDVAENYENHIISYNYPNPFSETTDITITIPDFNNVEIIVSDILGKSVILNDSFSYTNNMVTVSFSPDELFGNTFYYKVIQNNKVISGGLMLQK